MRDFRDAKAMAHSLREALKAKAIPTTHSESLELIAKAFGYDNWNILSAKIDGAPSRSGVAVGPQDQTVQEGSLCCSFCGKSRHQVRTLIAGPSAHICNECIDAAQSRAATTTSPQTRPAPDKPLYCSFCGKSQHEVQKLIAGPAVFICDECVDLCIDIVDEHLLRLVEGDETSARAMSTERLQHYVAHATRGTQRNRLALQRIETVLAHQANPSAIENGTLRSAGLAQLTTKTSDELRAMQTHAQDQLRRYEQAVRTATPIIDERAGP